MRDFPPEINTFYSAAGRKPGPAPDTRTPAAFLRWFLKFQWPLILLTTAVGVLWQLPLTLGPWLFGKAIDEGSCPAPWSGTLKYAGLLLLVTLIGALFGIVMHTLIVRTWLIAMYGTMKMVTRKVAQMGHVLPRRTPTGEVLSVAGGDSDEFGALTEIAARAPVALIAYLVVAGIVLCTSPELGIVCWSPLRCSWCWPCRCCGRCSAARSSSATATPTSPRWPPTSSPGCGSCAASAASGRSPATTPASPSWPGRPASRPGIWQAAIEAVGVLFSGRVPGAADLARRAGR